MLKKNKKNFRVRKLHVEWEFTFGETTFCVYIDHEKKTFFVVCTRGDAGEELYRLIFNLYFGNYDCRKDYICSVKDTSDAESTTLCSLSDLYEAYKNLSNQKLLNHE